MNRYLQESYEEALRENELLKAKLEQAEKALEEIYNVESLCERDSLLHALTEVNQIADKALQAIRKGD